MKSSSVVVTLIIIVVALGAVWYFFMQPGGVLAPSTGTTTNDNPNGQDYSPNGTVPAGGSDSDTSTSAPSPAFSIVTSSTLGPVLAASNGMTLYTYSPDADTPGASSCGGSCAVNWPPYTVPSAAGLGVSTGMSGTFGTIVRADDTIQVTYNGKPLYFYIKDKKSGDVVGQGVGGVWYVVKP